MDFCVSCHAGLPVGPGPRRRQQGAALLTVLTVLILAGTALLLERLNARPARSLAEARMVSDSLTQARAALIGFAASHPTEPGRLPYPDRRHDGNWDGVSDCWSRVGGRIGAHLALGRLPWQGDLVGRTGCGGPQWHIESSAPWQRHDGLWYAVSRNLLFRTRTQDRPALNWRLVDQAPPYPWLTVRNAAGEIISDEVAAVVIHPGPPLSHQDRRWDEGKPPATGSAAYLDSVVIGALEFDNADADGCRDDQPDCNHRSAANGAGEDFIAGSPSASFNDRLSFISARDLFSVVERRVAGDTAEVLERYRTSYGGYPWLSPYVDPSTVDSGNPRTGWSDPGSKGNRLVDFDTDFTKGDPVRVGDLLELVDQGRFTTVVAVEPNALSVSGGPLGPDQAYNIRPAYNGRTKTRQGQLPFVDVRKAERFSFNTGFDVQWRAPTDVATAHSVLAPVYAGDRVDGLTKHAPDALATSRPDVVLSGISGRRGGAPASAVVAAVKAAVWGRNGKLMVGNLLAATGNGRCEWTGDPQHVVCMGSVIGQDAGYSVTLTEHRPTPMPPIVHAGVPVRRDFSFKLNFSGILRADRYGNFKTRAVASSSPLALGPGEIDMWVQVDEFVSTKPMLGQDYRLHSVRMTSLNGTDAQFDVSGISDDLQPGLDLPAYLVDNDWYRYLYIATTASSIGKDPTHSGRISHSGRTLQHGSTLIDLDADFHAAGIQVGDFVRNVSAQSQGFVSRVIDENTLEIGRESSPYLSGVAGRASDRTTLVDLDANFVASRVRVGDTVVNWSDGSSGTVTDVRPERLGLSKLAGGTNNRFAPLDHYALTRSHDRGQPWYRGHRYEIWSRRCDSPGVGTAPDPSADCLMTDTSTLENLRGPVTPNPQAVVVAAGPQLSGQLRGMARACGSQSAGFCDYFEFVNPMERGRGPRPVGFQPDAVESSINDRVRWLPSIATH